jgi:hypothetical protein
VAWGTYDATVPPTLLTGGVVQFDSARALAALIEPELSHHRLLCIDLADLALNRECDFVVRVRDRPGEVKLRGKGVHRHADLIGLEVHCDAEDLRALRRLAGAAALLHARNTAPIPVMNPSSSIVPEPPPAPEPPPSIVPDPPPSIVPEPPPLAPEPPIVAAPPIIALPDPITAPPGPLVIDPFAGAEDEREFTSLFGVTSEERLESEPPQALPTESAEVAGALDGVWVETTRVEGLFDDLGGLMTPMEPGPMTLESQPTASVEPRRAPAPESGTWLVAPGLAFFVGRRGQLVRGLRDLAGRSGRLVVGTGNDRLTLELDAARHLLLLDHNGMPVPAEGDDPRSRVEVRRKGLAERFAVFAQPSADTRDRTVSWVYVPGPPQTNLPPNERVGFAQFVVALADAVLAPGGTEVLASHFEDQLDQWPVLTAVRGLTAQNVAVERLQARFVTESLDGKRTLRDAIPISPLGRPRTLRFLVMLEALGLLDFESAPPQVAREQAGSDLVAALRDRVERARVDHFTALGVHYASHPSEFGPAMERIAAKYGPTSPLGVAGGELKRLADEVVRRAREAHSLLADRDWRIAYRKERLSGMQLLAAAELLHGQMKLAAMRKDEARVHQLLDLVGEMDPQRLLTD